MDKRDKEIVELENKISLTGDIVAGILVSMIVIVTEMFGELLKVFLGIDRIIVLLVAIPILFYYFKRFFKQLEIAFEKRLKLAGEVGRSKRIRKTKKKKR